MSTPEPCSRTWALHAGSICAAEAMHLLGIRGTGTPGSCAQNHPVVFAALIQAQAIDRLAETLTEAAESLEPLERIAGAMEANRARGDEPADIRQEEARQFAEEQREELTRDTAPDPLPIRIGKGWIHGVTPEATGLRRPDEWVKVYSPSDSDTWEWAYASEVTDEDLWAPQHVDSYPLDRDVTIRPRPVPSTTAPRDFVDSADQPQLPPWITDHLPNEFVASKGWVQVRAGGIFASFANGDRGRIKPWNAVATGEAWAPLCLTKTFTYHVADAIPWKGFLAASSSTPSNEPAEPATTPAEPTTASSTPQEPPQAASATPGGHPLDQGGWIRSRVPTEGERNASGDVMVCTPDGEDWDFIPWYLVAPGQPWAPASAEGSSLSAPAPLPAHLAYPTSEGWVHDRVPGPKDGVGNGHVIIPANGCWAWLNWSHVVPGQPWRPLRTPAP